LAEGVDPEGSPALSLRAGQLQGAGRRRCLANRLEKLIGSAERCAAKRVSTAVDTEEVLAARSPLLGLVERLRAPGLVAPRGVAMVKQLLAAGNSPIYSPEWTNARSASGELERRARTALVALDDRSSGPLA
jgi:hypothetical protein